MCVIQLFLLFFLLVFVASFFFPRQSPYEEGMNSDAESEEGTLEICTLKYYTRYCEQDDENPKTKENRIEREEKNEKEELKRE